MESTEEMMEVTGINDRNNVGNDGNDRGNNGNDGRNARNDGRNDGGTT